MWDKVVTRSDSKRTITRHSDRAAPFWWPKHNAGFAALSTSCVNAARMVSDNVPTLVHTVPPPQASSDRTAGAGIGRFAPLQCHHADGKTNLQPVKEINSIYAQHMHEIRATRNILT